MTALRGRGGAGGGDSVRCVKRGIMELADVRVVSKVGGVVRGPAETAAAEYASALQLLRPKTPGWTPTVVQCSALEGTGSLG